jgi:hypothetical protein
VQRAQKVPKVTAQRTAEPLLTYAVAEMEPLRRCRLIRLCLSVQPSRMCQSVLRSMYLVGVLYVSVGESRRQRRHKHASVDGLEAVRRLVSGPETSRPLVCLFRCLCPRYPDHSYAHSHSRTLTRTYNVPTAPS